MPFRSVLIFIATLTCALSVHARLDTISGTRVAIGMAQSILASPPLPGLESKDNGLVVQLSHVVTHMDGYDALSNTHYNGDFTGGGVSLGYTSKMMGNWNMFAIGQYSLSTGEGNNSLNDPMGVHEMQQNGWVGIAGAGYRLLGKDDGRFNFGVFGGMGALQVASELGLGGSKFFSDSFIWGPVAGAQLRARLWKVQLRPYAIAFYESSDHCKRTTTDSGATVSNGMPCRADAPDQVNIPATFSAIGLYLGWGRVAVNVYSKVSNDEAMSDLKMFRYSLRLNF